jgi:heme-degrading monooxygenase HmoA
MTMIVIRNVFRCKPGQAKELVKRFKQSIPLMKEHSGGNARVLTDVSAPFWTVVFETEAESLEAFERNFAKYGADAEVQKVMAGYMESVDGGHREIWKVE